MRLETLEKLENPTKRGGSFFNFAAAAGLLPQLARDGITRKVPAADRKLAS